MNKAGRYEKELSSMKRNGSENPSLEEKQKENRANRVMYTVTGQEETILIPVGTSVNTQLGTKTTFSRLKAGDMIKMLKETDENGSEVIVEIWMIQ